MPSRAHYGDALQLKADLWRVPLALCLAAVLLLLVTVKVDLAAARGTLSLPSWISIGAAEDARAILGALLGAVSTVLALIFSVALLVLSMAVSQFGPRILYRFVRDGITQLTIGLFLAAFVYTLLTFVVTRQQGNHEFVPQLTLCCSVVLVMASFAFLVVFSHRIAMSIQTQNVVAHIVTDFDAAIGEWRAETGTHAEPGRFRPVRRSSTPSSRGARQRVRRSRPRAPASSRRSTTWTSWRRPSGPRRSCGSCTARASS